MFKIKVVLVVLISLLFVSCKQKIIPLEKNSSEKKIGDYLYNTKALLENIKTLSSDAFEGRRTGTSGALKSQNYIIEHFKKRGVAPLDNSYKQSFQFKSRGKAYQGVNVLGVIEGTEAAQNYIVISAHYDHEGIKQGEIYNGADDDASGISALFAFAEYFKTNPPKHHIILAAFDGEELGLKGADFFVNNSIVPLEHIKLNLNMDMISRSKKNELFVVGTRYYKQLEPALINFNGFGEVNLLIGHDGNDQKEDWTYSSDHALFHKKNIPFLYFGVVDHEDYHKPTDVFENINVEFYKDAVQSVILVFQKLDALKL
jgi:hypothetical protein